MFRAPTRFILFALLGFAGTGRAAALGNIKVDQLGYLTWTPKVAVLARPMVGQGSPSSFDPGSSFEIRRVSDNGTAFTGSPASFGGGTTHAQSGDIGWWADFSALTTPGDYYLYLGGGTNPGAQSYPFKIGPDIYTAALAASSKSYYYQRCGTAITAPYGGAWTHAACHVATESAAHLYDGGDQGAGTARDITGGWHDAGDYRKYVSFTTEPLWDLLHSYEWYPCGYGDANGIPESGNGVPDILDEVKWELDWLLKMQISGGANDGALYSGAFVTGGAGGTGDPSTETATYYYANYSSAATAVGAFAFALGARILGAQPAYAAYAATLQAASVRAWTWLQAHPSNVTYNQTGFQNADANRSAPEDAGLRLLAAAELFALTGSSTYQAYFDANYNSASLTNNSHNPILNNYFETGASGIAQRALVSYALAPGATGSVLTAIRTSAKNGANNYPVAYYLSDLYRSFMWDGHYSWGSNQAKATWGEICLWAIKIGANPASNATWWNVASEYLHYFFGRNTLGWSFTTQSQLVGADQPVTSFFHSWFGEGTPYSSNAAPGFLTGGPNQAYATDVGYSGGTAAYPPAGEPVQKSYKDWNKVWPDCSWTVTENGIYYQAKYQFLLAAFSGCTAPPGTPTPTPTYTNYAGSPTSTFTPTPSYSATATPTPVCQTLLNGAESLAENGAWSGVNALRSIVNAGSAPAGAVTQGSNALYVNVTATAGWNDGLANLAGALPSDWSPYTQLKMDVHVAASLVAGATYSELLLRADCASCGAGLWYQPISADAPNLVAGPQTVTWALDFSQGTIPPGSAVSKLTLVYNNNASSPTGALYIDNIRLIGACTAPSPTRSPTATASRTPSPSPSASPSATPSASPSATLTPVASSPTGSPSPTSTPSASPSATLSPSFSVSPTETPYAGTPTDTATVTPSATASPSVTVSPTPPCPGAAYFGNVTVLATYDISGYIDGDRWSLASPGTLGAVQFYIGSGSGQVRVGVYADAAGAPGALLTQGGPQVFGPGVQSLDVTPVDLTPGIYWLFLQADPGVYVGAASSGGQEYYQPYAFGAFPAALSGGAYDAYVICMRGVLCPLPTPTVTPSSTASPSATPSQTASASPSVTSTLTPSPSPTRSATPSISATATKSWTPLPGSATSTPTPSLTWSATSTVALGSATPTPSASPTWTASPAPTASSSPTLTPGAAPTATPSPEALSGALVIDAAAAWPNPNPGALSFKLEGAADRIDARVYTAAWIAVAEWKGGPYNAGWNRLALAKGWSQDLAQGIYYVQIRAWRGAVVSSSVTKKFYLLR